MSTNTRIHEQLKDFILWMRGPEYTKRRQAAMKYYHSLERRDGTLLLHHAERAMWIFISDIMTSDVSLSENMVLNIKDYSMALLLHDVLEDTEITENDLRETGLWSEKTIDLVKSLTKDTSTQRFDDIRCIKMLSDLIDMPDDVRRLKLADRSDNMDVNLGYKLKYFKKTHSEVQNFIKFVHTYSFETSVLLRHFLEFGHDHDGLEYTLNILSSRINNRILGNVLEVCPDEFLEELTRSISFENTHNTLLNKINESTKVHKGYRRAIDTFIITFHTSVIFKHISEIVKSDIMNLNSEKDVDSITKYIIELREYVDGVASSNPEGYIRKTYMETTSFVLNRLLNYVENLQAISNLEDGEV